MAERESDIQSAICDYLAYRKHFFWRQNTSPTVQKNNDGTWRFRKMPKYAMRGVPDIIVVHVGRPFFLEVKRPGSYQSPDQKTFQASAEAAGAFYTVVRSIDDVMALGL